MLSTWIVVRDVGAERQVLRHRRAVVLEKVIAIGAGGAVRVGDRMSGSKNAPVAPSASV